MNFSLLPRLPAISHLKITHDFNKEEWTWKLTTMESGASLHHSFFLLVGYWMFKILWLRESWMFLPTLDACLHPALVLFPILELGFMLRFHSDPDLDFLCFWLNPHHLQKKKKKSVWVDQRFRWFKGVCNSYAVYLKFWWILVLLNEIVKPNVKKFSFLLL